MKMIKLTAVVLLFAMLALLFAACGEKKLQEFYYSPGDPFITNIPDTSKLMKATVVVGISEEDSALLSEKNAVVRDSILRVLRAQTDEALADPDVQTKLSDEITAQLNALFPVEEGAWPLVLKVYFTDFVVQ